MSNLKEEDVLESQASASMLTEMVIDKPLTNVKDIDKTDILENIGLTNLGPASKSAPS